MQTIAARQSSRVAAARTTRSVRVAKLNVVAKATPQEFAKKAALAASTLPAMLVSHPAFALVDERMNGDGTGRPLGINDGVLGWTMAGVFGLIWTSWYLSQRELGDFEDTDAGLKIDDTD